MSRESLPSLVERAAAGDSGQYAGQAQAARAELTRRRLAEPNALEAILAALGAASPGALEAAGDWLFFPEQDDDPRLGLGLAGRAGELLKLAAARPVASWKEGLAWILGLAGGRPLAGLLRLARRAAWARAVVADLPPDLKLPGWLSPGQWLAQRELGPDRARQVRGLLTRRDWPALAGLDRAHLTVAHRQARAYAHPNWGGALAWPGGDLAVMEAMAELTAREGARAAALAAAASRHTGRVVVLMGNASLGGPPLWAAPSPWEQGWPAAQPVALPPKRATAELVRLRARRLAGPELLQGLWRMRCAAEVEGRGWELLRQRLAQARPWLAPGQAEQVAEGTLALALGEYSLPQASEKAWLALSLARDLENQGRRAIKWIYGLAAEAGRPAPGRALARPLVLPWVDKFAASTGKAADHVYLAALAGMLAELDPPPLLLLLDETPHPGSASLKVILEAAARLHPGLVLRGLGCFGGRPEPRDLEEALLEASRDAHLVALRPLPGRQPGPSLDEVLAGRAAAAGLSPAGRDGAGWLLAGTALASLGAPGELAGRDEPAPWLLTARGFAALGAWFRHRVRALAGRADPPAGAAGRFWRGYMRVCGLD